MESSNARWKQLVWNSKLNCFISTMNGFPHDQLSKKLLKCVNRFTIPNESFASRSCVLGLIICLSWKKKRNFLLCISLSLKEEVTCGNYLFPLSLSGEFNP